MENINDLMAAYSRDNREPFKRVFKKALEISHEKWVLEMEEIASDYHPIGSYIASGEYGNSILIIFDSKYDLEVIPQDDRRLYLQWTYQHKGSLYTQYYVVEEREENFK